MVGYFQKAAQLFRLLPKPEQEKGVVGFFDEPFAVAKKAAKKKMLKYKRVFQPSLKFLNESVSAPFVVMGA